MIKLNSIIFNFILNYDIENALSCPPTLLFFLYLKIIMCVLNFFLHADYIHKNRSE